MIQGGGGSSEVNSSVQIMHSVGWPSGIMKEVIGSSSSFDGCGGV